LSFAFSAFLVPLHVSSSLHQNNVNEVLTDQLKLDVSAA